MFDISVQGGNEVVLSGRLDAAQVPRLNGIVDSINTDCIVNFKELAYISSAGLGSLINLHVRLKKTGNTVKLINMNDHIREVFKYSRLDKVFTIE